MLSSDGPVSGDARPARLLVVDDHQDARQVMEAYLRANGFEVAGAGDGHEALAKVKSGGYDLVILDLVMPRLDGLGFLRALRGLPGALSALPVVVVAGVPPPVVAGASACFRKPAPLGELLKTVRALAGGAAARA